ncbi:MAG: tetratricopeptide repeat protein [Bacillota bacterium]
MAGLSLDAQRRVREWKQAGWQAYQRAFTEGRSQLAVALSSFSSAEAECRKVRDFQELVGVLSGLGAVARATGGKEELEKALRYYWEEVDILTSLGRQLEAADRHAELEAVYRDLAMVDAEKALVYLKEGLEVGIKALDVARQCQDREIMARVGTAVADICQLISEHDCEYAEYHLEMAADLYLQAAGTWEEVEGKAMANMGLAEVYIRLGKNLDGARELLEQAMETYVKLPGGQVDYQVAQVHALLGRLFAVSGDRARAARHIRDAVAIFKRLGVDLGGRTEAT